MAYRSTVLFAAWSVSVKDFDPNQLRAPNGRWTRLGGGSSLDQQAAELRRLLDVEANRPRRRKPVGTTVREQRIQTRLNEVETARAAQKPVPPKPKPAPARRRTGGRSLDQQAVELQRLLDVEASRPGRRKPVGTTAREQRIQARLDEVQTERATRGPTSLRQPGRDIEKEARRDLAAIAVERDWSAYGDPGLTNLTKRQKGWDQPAQVVTPEQLDAAVADGWTHSWRGIRDYWEGGRTAAELAEQTRTGDWQMGYGIYGNGVYTSTRRTTAETYRGGWLNGGDWDANHEWVGSFADTAKGGLLRIAIDPNARLADYHTLEAEHRAYYDSLPVGQWRDEASTFGWYAVMRGYDGVRVRGVQGINDGASYPAGVANNSEADQYIVYNRSVLMIEEASDRYDT